MEPSPTAWLAAILATEPTTTNPYKAAKAATQLARLGKQAQREAAAQCNGIMRYDPQLKRDVATWTSADEDHKDIVTTRVRTKATIILADYGAGNVTVHGDPRGHVLKFKLASGRSNRGDKEWGI